MRPRHLIAVSAVLLLALSGCATTAPADTVAAPGSASSASAPTAAASVEPVASGTCIPTDVAAAGIPLVAGEPVCDLVRGTLADDDLSIVIEVGSVDAGFTEATAALEAAGYSAAVKAPEGSSYTNGTYSVQLVVDEQAPYGAVATYAISRA